MNLDEIGRQGAQRYFTDKGVYRNLHTNGSAEFNAFERDWMQSLKKDEGRLVNAFSPAPIAEKKRGDASTGKFQASCRVRVSQEERWIIKAGRCSIDAYGMAPNAYFVV